MKYLLLAAGFIFSFSIQAHQVDVGDWTYIPDENVIISDQASLEGHKDQTHIVVQVEKSQLYFIMEEKQPEQHCYAEWDEQSITLTINGKPFDFETGTNAACQHFFKPINTRVRQLLVQVLQSESFVEIEAEDRVIAKLNLVGTKYALKHIQESI